MAMTGVLLGLGLVGGFVSGLLGLGGAVLMVPLLLFVPPLFHLPALSMRVVAGISMVQVFFSALSAVVAHWRHAHVSGEVVRWVGIPAGLAAFAGAWLSARTTSRELELLFAAISTLAFAIMLLPPPRDAGGEAPSEVRVARPLALAIALAVGLVGGMVGAPGAFIFVPLLIYVLKVPTRITLGSTLVVVLFGAAAGLAGKLGSGQIVWSLALPLALGSVAGAQAGGWLSARTRVGVLRWGLVAIIGVSTAKIWLGL
jgi:uncharacterized membrane protein YfcA